MRNGQRRRTKAYVKLPMTKYIVSYAFNSQNAQKIPQTRNGQRRRTKAYVELSVTKHMVSYARSART